MNSFARSYLHINGLTCLSKWPKPCLEAVLKFLENVLFRNAVRGKSSRILGSHCTQPIQPWQWFLCCWTPLHGNHFCLKILIFSDYNWLLRAKQHSIQTFSLNILTNCACLKKTSLSLTFNVLNLANQQ